MPVRNQLEEENEGSSILVLCVDDSPQMGDLVETYLEKLHDDLSVVTETAADDGLDRLSEAPVDCVVSDYEMPGMNGIAFLNAVRDDYPNLPFILYTGKGSEQVASKATTAGVSAYVKKGGPETFELLLNQIDNLVSKRRAEHRARVTRQRLFDMYEQIDGFFAVDGDWTVTYWNQQMVARTGFSSETIMGGSFWDAFPEAEGTELGDRYREAFETRDSTEFETYYEPHGYWVHVRVFPMQEGLFVHSREITEKKAQERELQWRNERLETFAKSLSHDLRTPLNVAEGNLELAQQTGDSDYLAEVERAHNRMGNLLEELLRLARGENLETDPVSVQTIATNAWQTVRTREMDLTVESDGVVLANDVHLRQVFENLFGNAGKHGNASQIRIGVLESHSGIYIEDDGTGLPDDSGDEVFVSGYSTMEGSPGYGLSIISQICEAHDWSIQALEGQEGGARFEITEMDVRHE